MSTATVAMNGWTGDFNRPAMLLAATGAVGICVYMAAFHGWRRSGISASNTALTLFAFEKTVNDKDREEITKDMADKLAKLADTVDKVLSNSG